jgi:acetyl esterase
MPVDPQIQALLDAGRHLPRTETMPVPRARAQYEARIAAMAPAAPIAGTTERVIEGPDGQPLRIRVYTPLGQGPHPLLVFFHGSGFVLCSLDTHDGICRNLAAGAGCVVASVDYRLAPEHPYPAAPEDCLLATRWCVAHAAELGADPARVILGGDSAGGNLAAVTALRLRDAGGPKLLGQLLLYPVTDWHQPGWPSYAENAEGYGLTRATMEWFWGHYVPRPEGLTRHPHVAPIHAPDLAGLPPALVTTAEYDPLRDEAEAFAAKLAAAGVPVACSRWLGLNHGFYFWCGKVDRTTLAMAEATAWLREAFAGAPRSGPMIAR